MLFHSISDLSSMYGHLNKVSYAVCNAKYILAWTHSLWSFFPPDHLKENASPYLKEKPGHRNSFIICQAAISVLGATQASALLFITPACAWDVFILSASSNQEQDALEPGCSPAKQIIP